MIEIQKITYRVVAVTAEGEQLDLTDITHALGWSEGEKELSARITLKLANVEYGGKLVSEMVQPFTPIFIYAGSDSLAEVIRGTVQKWSMRETNGEMFLEIEAADEVQALRHNQSEKYFTDGHTSTAILEEILNEWGVPHELQITDVAHGKKVYRKKYLIDMINDVLKDLKEKGGGVYFVRAKEGVVQIIPRGTNETTYHFDMADNLTRTHESFDVSKIVTRILVVAKSKEEGHQKIESTVDGKIDLGVRQIIYERGDKETPEEAETAAKKILEEQGDVERETTIESPDVPSIRKGDRIRVKSSSGESYFFIKSIRHNAASQRMTMELDEDKEKNAAAGESYDTDHSDESGSSSPP